MHVVRVYRLSAFLPALLVSALFLALFLALFPAPVRAQKAAITEVRVSRTEEAGPESLQLSVTYAIPEGFYQSLAPDFFFFELTGLVSSSGKEVLNRVSMGDIAYPEGRIEETGENLYGEVTLTASLSLPASLESGSYSGKLKAHYQLCDKTGTCFLPGSSEESFTFDFEGNGGAAAGLDKSLLTMLLFALIGGLLLNIMPCVFPILSIRALNLVKQSGNDPRGLRTGALLYGAGVLVSFLVLAGTVIVLKRSGELVGWGFQFQNPGFVLTLSAILFVFALSLFDLFVFQPPVLGSKLAAAQSKGLMGSFINGLFAVVLATPCTAPFLGSALGFAFSQPPLSIVLFFITIGAGFSLPFVLLGFIPGAVRWIPKPGRWMIVFKEAMGLVLLATAVYFFDIYSRQAGSGAVAAALYFFLILASVLWIYGKLAAPGASSLKKWTGLVLLIAVPLSAGLLLLPAGTGNDDRAASTADYSGAGPERITFTPETMEELVSAQTPVLLVFSARWCSVCKLNDRRVLATNRAEELFREHGVSMVYGDFTNQDPVIARRISELGRAGVPVYALYRPGAEKPLLLPELLSFEILEEAFSTINAVPAPVEAPLEDLLFF
jgi:thiol:disulfide interchange protein DsbD